MRKAILLSWVAAVLAGCGPLPPPPDTARLPPGVFSPLDQDIPAVQYAQYAFADASRTYGNPVAGAQAVLAMDYIAGQLNSSPRWANIDAATQQQLLQSRAEVRQALGIVPNAPSQAVIDSLVTARNDLAGGDTAAAARALNTPLFSRGGEQTVQALANLPYIQVANVATTHANEELFGPNDGSGFVSP